MENSHSFFCNRACRYFPCHQPEWAVQRPQDFNCLFCYCPLYFLADCGGRPKWLANVKDCSACDLPHAPGGYERVLERLRRHFQEVRREAGPEQNGP